MLVNRTVKRVPIAIFIVLTVVICILTGSGWPNQVSSAFAQSSQVTVPSVVLIQSGPNFSALIRQLYPLAGLNLKNTISLAQHPPSVVLHAATLQEAQNAQTLIQATGARAEIVSFHMTVKDVSTIRGRGTLVTGTVTHGTLRKGDSVKLIGPNAESISTIVTGIDLFHKALDEAKAGDNIGVLLRGVEKTDVKIGMSLIKPYIAPYQLFQAQIYLLTSLEGGSRNALPGNSRVQIRLSNSEVTGQIDLPSGVTATPGVVVSATVTLSSPLNLDNGSWFDIYQQGKLIGFGVVTVPLH